jgi:prevent-host-death family protein
LTGVELVATIATRGESMQLVGIRELKNRLTHYLKIAKSGDKIIVTDRGVPVAILHNLDQVEEESTLGERLVYFSKQGFLTLPRKQSAFPPIERIKIKGESLSDTVIKERR